MVVAENRQGAAELVVEELEMPLAQPINRAGLDEPFARILADRLQEAVPALAGELNVNNHEGLADQPRQQIEHVLLVDAVAPAYVLSGLERPRGWKHRQPAEQLAFDVRQQLVTPVYGRLERPLSGDGRSRAAGKQAESVLQPRLDLRRRQDDDAGGRQLNGEGNPIEPPADTGDGVRVVRGRLEGRVNGTRALDEKPRGIVLDVRFDLDR